MTAPRLGTILLALASGCPCLHGQSAGVGTTDLHVLLLAADTGQPVPRARVIARNEATAQTFVVEAREGEVTLRLLPPGNYVLLVSAPGRPSLRVPGLVLHVASTTSLRLRMPADTGAVVVVEAPRDPIQPGLAAVYDQAAIAGLPIARRTFLDFTLLTAGVARANAPENGGAAANSGLSFWGGNPRQNDVRVDGFDNNDLSVGSVRSTFSQEVVQEFRVVPTGFSAEYGRATGGTVNILTRGGTNTPEGSLFAFTRPGALAASPPPGGLSPVRQYQFGASTGFPILQDRLFCFAGGERLLSDSNDTVAFPSTYRKDDGTVVDLSAAFRAAGFSVEQGPLPLAESGSFGFLRLDWLPRVSHVLTLRVNHARESNEGQLPWGGPTASSAGGSRRIRDTTVALAHQMSVTPDLVNEARLMWSQRDHDLESLDPLGTPLVLILGYATFGSERYLPQTRTESTWQAAETLTWSHGAHTFKGGVDALRTRILGRIPLFFRGVYRFQGLNASLPDGMAAFLAPNPFGGTGLPAVYTQGFGDPSVSGTLTSTAAFLQWDGRFHPTFTLRLGLRYDRQEVPAFPDTPSYALLREASATSAGPNLGPLRMDPASQAYPYDALLTPTLDWSGGRASPRLSFTWQATPRLQVEGGWGIFTGRMVAAAWAAATTFNGERAIYVVRTAADTVPTGPFQAWAQPSHRYGARPSGLPSLLIPGDVRISETRQAHLGVEANLGPGLSLSFGLHHVRGRGFTYLRDVNALVPNPYFNTNPAVSPNPATRRPDLRFSSIYRYSGDGESRYTGQTLGAVWTRSGLVLRAAYTHGKAEDNYTDITTDLQPQNSYDLGQEWGPSWHDQRHRLTASLAWNGLEARTPWLRGWEVALLANLSSGRPYSRLAGTDLNRNGDGVSDRVGLGPRNTETGPSTQTVDARLSRVFQLRKARLVLLAEVFNLANRSNPTQVQAYVNGTTPFGTPTAYGPRRQIQVGSRLSF